MLKLCWHNRPGPNGISSSSQQGRLESIMLHNLLIMLFGISPIFCLLCSFLCFLGMHYADNIIVHFCIKMIMIGIKCEL